MLLVFFITKASSVRAADPPNDPPKADAKADPKPADNKDPAPVAQADNAAANIKGMQTPKEPDPTGGNVGTGVVPATDGKGDDPSKMKNGDLLERIIHNFISINTIWTLISGFLVMFMQAGFMLVEVGLCRAKNAAHTAAMNLMVYPLGCIAFWAYGFAIGWGNWNAGPVPEAYAIPLGNGLQLLDKGYSIEVKDGDATKSYGLIGLKGFGLYGLDDVSVMTYFFFMMVFMDTTATIPTGAMAERWAWKNFCLFGLWVALPYCLFANWVWGGGWLAQAGVNWGWGHGAVDFAGSGVVHAMGGIISLAGAIIIGPRIGKFVDGKPRPIPAHHVPMVVAGTFILAFGWFGFNAGSTLSGADLRISVVVVNTMLAGVAGSLSSMCTLWAKRMKPDTTMMCNGMLAGLVAVTAPCAFIDSWAAVVIGGIAGIVVVLSVFFWERMGIDDPVGAISVHGVNGVWGVLSLGIFANGKYGDGLNGIKGGVAGLIMGDVGQFKAQCLDAAVVLVFGFVMAYVWFKVSNLITPLRVSAEVELGGLDVPEMGIEGYPDFAVAKLS